MGSEHSSHRRLNRTVLLSGENMSVGNNYHPLRFHHVHGDNITLMNGRTTACRSEGFCKGLVFSDRPVLINERVYVKFLDTSPNWSGALRIGFTMLDPFSFKSKLPKFACPDLTSIHGNWAKAVGEKLVKKGSTLYFYVDQNGDVHYGIEAEEYGIFFGGVNTSGKLWAVLDIYGNTIAVEFLDPQTIIGSTLSDLKKIGGKNVSPLSFHLIHGKHATLKKGRTILTKSEIYSSLTYAFSEKPIEPGTSVLMKVLELDPYNKGYFVYGITSCDPKDVTSDDLPVNAFDLLDRPEYWVVKKKAYPYEIGDTITISIGNQGNVEFTVNDEPEPVFYVEYTQPLWLFVNVDEEISELKLIGTIEESSFQNSLCDALSELKIKSSGDNKQPGPSGQQPTNECVICYEESVDCVLYRCGHMCMCYTCAFKVFESRAKYCPICRICITDVIKIYK